MSGTSKAKKNTKKPGTSTTTAKAKAQKSAGNPVKAAKTPARRAAAAKKAPAAPKAATPAAKAKAAKPASKSAPKARPAPKKTAKAPPKAKPAAPKAKPAAPKAKAKPAVKAKAKPAAPKAKPAASKAKAKPAPKATKAPAPKATKAKAKPAPKKTASAPSKSKPAAKAPSRKAPAAKSGKSGSSKSAKSGKGGSQAINGKALENAPFSAGEFVVYPPHGVGRIVDVSTETIADSTLKLLVVEFERDKLILRVPLPKVESVGLRRLSENSVVNKAMETLRRRAQVRRTLWSRRSQEYNSKINSGDMISIAEVVRDLFRPKRQHEQSYSERKIYEMARDRIAQELAAIQGIEESSAQQKIEKNLQKAYA